jgi:hypothetical protein
MGRKVYILGFIFVAVIVVLTGVFFLRLRSQQYPEWKSVEPSIDSFFPSNGYFIVSEKRDQMPRTPVPAALKIMNIGKTLNSNHRFDGLRTPYVRGCTFDYTNPASGGECEVRIDICGQKVYCVTLVANQNSSALFQKFTNSLEMFKVPAFLDQKNTIK